MKNGRVIPIGSAQQVIAQRVLAAKVGLLAARLAVTVLVHGQQSALEKWRMLQTECGLNALEAAELMRSLGVDKDLQLCPECDQPITSRQPCVMNPVTKESRHSRCAS